MFLMVSLNDVLMVHNLRQINKLFQDNDKIVTLEL